MKTTAELVAENDKLKAWIEYDATCPCCGEKVACAEDCTFAIDSYPDAQKMKEARELLQG